MYCKVVENEPSKFAPNGWNDLYFQCGKFALRLDTAPTVCLQIYWNASFWYTGLFIKISKHGISYLYKHEWDEV